VEEGIWECRNKKEDDSHLIPLEQNKITKRLTQLQDFSSDYCGKLSSHTIKRCTLNVWSLKNVISK